MDRRRSRAGVARFRISGERRLLTLVASTRHAGARGRPALDGLCEHVGSGDVPEMPGTTEHEDFLRLNSREISGGRLHVLLSTPCSETRENEKDILPLSVIEATTPAFKPFFAVFSEI
jgi:hypothetical protein